MSVPLALKYRPQSFADVVGQKLTAIVLGQMVKTDSVPNALLFRGPRGTGKTSVARILAMELNPTERENILAGKSLSVIEIDAASNGSVADIRALTDSLRYSVGSVIILDEAHSISREGFNALLKTLEEPPEGVTFVLVTTEPEKLPETVLSRLMKFEFRRVSPVELLARIEAVAAAEDIPIERDLAIKLAEHADGSVRDALMGLDLVHRAGISTVEQYVELVGEKDIAPLLFAAMLGGNHATMFHVFDKIMLETGDSRNVSTALNSLIRDIFVIKSEGRIESAGKAYEDRVKLAQSVPSDSLRNAVQVLWDLKTKVRQNEDHRSSLEQALVLMSAALTAGRQIDPITPRIEKLSPVASEPTERPLSLSEIQQS